mgnify:CR=1 FL=1
MAGIDSPSTSTVIPNVRLNRIKLAEYFDSAFSFKSGSEWKGDKRFFITFLPNVTNIAQGTETNKNQIPNYPIRTKLTGSYDNISGAKISNNLAELSTAEITGHNGTNHQLTLSRDFPLNQQYIAKSHGIGELIHQHPVTPPFFESGSYLISKLNDDNPSLLVELNKDQALPNGLGDKEFIVVPENLHPFVKDNLEYFLTRAGINISGDASQFIALDETNRNLL